MGISVHEIVMKVTVHSQVFKYTLWARKVTFWIKCNILIRIAIINETIIFYRLVICKYIVINNLNLYEIILNKFICITGKYVVRSMCKYAT